MAGGFVIDCKDGMLFLKGHLDETAEISSLLNVPAGVMRLNLSGVQSINSLGLRRLIECMHQLGEREIELHQCPPVFIEAVNVIPLVVGGQQHISRIKSLSLPYHCQADHEAVVVVPIGDVAVDDAITLPSPPCELCKRPMTPDLDSELDEFFFFLMA